ncbi:MULTISPECIES: single-stranded DNA-binding protein [unclassified Peribacillus]|uniref:single-stranded DNA-binding protein n=1 Tax=unclassified Peribacillus TaxID=2675266 RepID=UPI00366E6829
MMNRVVLVGRLTKDPEIRYTPNGVPVATFTLAVNRSFTNQQGEREADFINCVVWRKPAENAANFLKKGSLAGVDGKVQTRNYEGQDGKRVYVTEILAESVQFLEPRSQNTGGNSQGNTNTSGNKQNSSQGNYMRNDDPFANDGTPIDISDDDLPF